MDRVTEHWKHRATRCAMPGCEHTRLQGWSTCGLISHRRRGVSLYGLKRDEPRLLPDPLCTGYGGSHGGHVLHNEPCPVHPEPTVNTADRGAIQATRRWAMHEDATGRVLNVWDTWHGSLRAVRIEGGAAGYVPEQSAYQGNVVTIPTEQRIF